MHVCDWSLFMNNHCNSSLGIHDNKLVYRNARYGTARIKILHQMRAGYNSGKHWWREFSETWVNFGEWNDSFPTHRHCRIWYQIKIYNHVSMKIRSFLRNFLLPGQVHDFNLYTFKERIFRGEFWNPRKIVKFTLNR